MALLEFLLAATGARIVTADILQRIAHRIMAVVAMRTVDVVMMCMVVIVIAIGTVYVGVVIHRCRYSGIKLPGIISPLVAMCTRRPASRPVFNSPSRR